MSEVLYAGAMVSSAGVAPNLAKVEAILDWEKPKTVLALMGFLGLTGHFQHLIKDYAWIVQPLTDLTECTVCKHMERKSITRCTEASTGTGVPGDTMG